MSDPKQSGPFVVKDLAMMMDALDGHEEFFVKMGKFGIKVFAGRADIAALKAKIADEVERLQKAESAEKQPKLEKVD